MAKNYQPTDQEAIEWPPLDFHDFHLRDLPKRLAAGHGLLAAQAARELPAISFRLQGTDNAYTFRPAVNTIDIVAGTEADTVVVLDAESWQGLVYDLESAPGLLYAGKLQPGSGDQMVFVQWEPALRAMFHGRPLYDPSLPLLDGQGQCLSADQSFSLDDAPQGIIDFLEAAGYALIKNVFSPDEIENFRVSAQQLKERAVEGDRESWWGKNAQGENILCRVMNAGVLDIFKSLYDDPRLKQIEALLPDELEALGADDIDGVTVIYKNPDMVEGLSDLPWHRDCGMGGHGVMCPKIICSIFLYDASDTAGPLKFLPGSHKASFGFMGASEAEPSTVVRANAEAGDVTLHYSDVMHAAPSPSALEGPHRVSVLLNYDRRNFQTHSGARHYNDVLLANDDGQVEHLQKVIDRN